MGLAELRQTAPLNPDTGAPEPNTEQLPPQNVRLVNGMSIFFLPEALPFSTVIGAYPARIRTDLGSSPAVTIQLKDKDTGRLGLVRRVGEQVLKSLGVNSPDIQHYNQGIVVEFRDDGISVYPVTGDVTAGEQPITVSQDRTNLLGGYTTRVEPPMGTVAPSGLEGIRLMIFSYTNHSIHLVGHENHKLLPFWNARHPNEVSLPQDPFWGSVMTLITDPDFLEGSASRMY